MKILTQTVNGEDVVFSEKIIKGGIDKKERNPIKGHERELPDKTNVVITTKNIEIEMESSELERVINALGFSVIRSGLEL